MAAVLLTMPGSHDQCTRLGRLLRSAHLVELPPLLNEIRRQIEIARSTLQENQFDGR
jgi:hypothetical protein